MEQTNLDIVLKLQYSMSMEINVLPLFKSHFSLGRSILTIANPMEEPKEEEDKLKDEYLIRPDSILEICKDNGLDKFFLIDDSISGFLQAHINSKKNGLELIFGLRLTVVDDVTVKDEASLKKENKIVLIARNNKGYKELMKISSCASMDGFYYRPRIDSSNLKRLGVDNLVCMVPFYDSFIFNNNFSIAQCCPDYLSIFDKENVIFTTEDNNHPFDDSLKGYVEKFVGDNGYETIKAKSIYYKQRADFIPYTTFRCIHNRTVLSKPNLDHFCSTEFCFDAWKEQNEQN